MIWVVCRCVYVWQRSSMATIHKVAVGTVPRSLDWNRYSNEKMLAIGNEEGEVVLWRQSG